MEAISSGIKIRQTEMRNTAILHFIQCCQKAELSKRVILKEIEVEREIYFDSHIITESKNRIVRLPEMKMRKKLLEWVRMEMLKYVKEKQKEIVTGKEMDGALLQI